MLIINSSHSSSDITVNPLADDFIEPLHMRKVPDIYMTSRTSRYRQGDANSIILKTFMMAFVHEPQINTSTQTSTRNHESIFFMLSDFHHVICYR